MFKGLQHIWVADGPIGIGKTALMSSVSDALASKHFEDVGSWSAFTAARYPILSEYYRGTPNGVNNFNTLVVASQFSSQLFSLGSRPSAIFERPLRACSHVFARILHDEGVIDDPTLSVFNYNVETYMLAQRLLFGDVPLTYIFLQGTPLLCQERCQKRQRPEDADISLATHQRVCAKYDEFYARLAGEGADVIPFDASLPLSTLSARLSSLLAHNAGKRVAPSLLS